MFFFPVETISRELDFRLLTGLILADKGFDVLIGQHNAINNVLPYLEGEGGVYVGKNFYSSISKPGDVSLLKKYKQKKIDFVHFHEEGAFYTGNEDDWLKTFKKLFTPSILDEHDYIFTWGKKQELIYKSENPHLANNIFSTGHPRFDLYKTPYKEIFKNEIKELKEKYSDFILLNSNLSIANHGRGIDSLFAKEYGFNADKEDLINRVGVFKQQNLQLYSFVELVYHLSLEFPEKNIIVRPHPSESIDFYKKVFSPLKNVHSVFEGPVNAWILACDFLIHNGCTTAIETSIAGKNILNYSPFPNYKFDQVILNTLGYNISNIDDAIEWVRKFYKGEFQKNIEHHDPRLIEIFSNLIEDSTSLFCQKLEEIALNKNIALKLSIKVKEKDLNKVYNKIQMKQKMQSSIYFLNKKKKKALKYHINKFPGINTESIKMKVNMINDLLGIKGEIKFINKGFVYLGK